MTNKQALFIIWNAILNQSQDAKKTLNSTFCLMERLGLISDFFTSFKKLNYELLFTAMTEKPMIHRFYNKMTHNLYLSVIHIMKCFAGLPCNVFLTSEKKEIINRLLEFNGIGLHKAEIAYMISGLYNESNDDTTDYIEQNIIACPALDETLGLELEP